jgi:hypothetical protein
MKTNKLFWIFAIFLLATPMVFATPDYATCRPQNCDSTKCIYWNTAINISDFKDPASSGNLPNATNNIFSWKSTQVADGMVYLNMSRYKNRPSTNGNYTLEFDYLTNSGNSGSYWGGWMIGNMHTKAQYLTNSMVFERDSQSTNLNIHSRSSATFSAIYTFEKMKWQHIKIEIRNDATKTQAWYINGTAKTGKVSTNGDTQVPIDAFNMYIDQSGYLFRIANITFYNSTQSSLCAGLPPATANFSIIAKSLWFDWTIKSFNVSMQNGSIGKVYNWTTTNGQINTTLKHYTNNWNFTATAHNHTLTRFVYPLTNNRQLNITPNFVKVNITLKNIFKPKLNATKQSILLFEPATPFTRTRTGSNRTTYFIGLRNLSNQINVTGNAYVNISSLFTLSKVTNYLSMNLTPLPPGKFNITNPGFNITFGAYDLMTINWTTSISQTTNITNYTISIYNSTGKFLSLKTFSNASRGYKWNTSTNLTSDIYRIGVMAKDTYPLNRTTYSQQFTYDSLYPRTRAEILIRDETTTALITENITATLIGNYQTFTGTTKSGYIRFDNLTADTYTAQFSGTNFTTRTYYVTIPRTTLTMTAWLLRTSTGQQVTITTKDASQNLMTDVSITATRFINSSWLTISQKNTDVSGTSAFFLKPYTTYRFLLQKQGYNTQLVNLEITQSTYTIYMYQNSTINFYKGGLGDITYALTPQFGQLAPKVSQTFALVTASASGQVGYFGMKTYFNGKNYSTNLSGTPGGGTTYLYVNTTTTNRTTLFLTYWIQNSDGGYMKLNRSYYLYNVTPGNYSLYRTLIDNANDINPFYRFLIAIIVSLILGAGFFTLLGATGAIGITLFSFIMFAIGGWVAWQFVIIPAILVIIGYIVTGGNEGT